MVRRISATALLVIAAVLVAVCSADAFGRSGDDSASPTVREHRLVRTFELARGAVLARPTAIEFPRRIDPATVAYHYTLADGLVAIEATDPLLWPNSELIRTNARWVSARAAYAQITVAPDLRPEGVLGSDTLVWIVFYRIGFTSGCVTGWRLYVDPLLLPSQNSGYVGPDYIITTPSNSRCDGLVEPRSLAASIYYSAPWRPIRHSPGRTTIRFEAGGCSTDIRVAKERHGVEERVQAIVGHLAAALCSEQQKSVTISVPPGVHLAHGRTGALPTRPVPSRPFS